MIIALASDHAGYALKMALRPILEANGYTVLDLGTDNPNLPDDYPDFALAMGMAIQKGQAERGILICGSGVGVSVAANKIPGIRAGICHDHYSAHQGVEHDDMNVLVLGSRIVGIRTAEESALAFLAARFTAEERHLRRLAKVRQIEENPPHTP